MIGLSKGVALLGAEDGQEVAAAQFVFEQAQLQVCLAREVTLRQARIFVVRRANSENKLAGALLCWRVADEVEVLDLAVLPEHRRKGAGGGLLSAALSYERKQGALHSFLEVRKDNHSAKALYQSLGFGQKGLRKAYYRDGEDAELYGLELKDLKERN